LKKIVALLIVSAILAGAAVFYQYYWHSEPTTVFRTVTVKKGEITAVVSAGGTLEPQEVVDVGSQVTGPILERGRDPKDPTKQIDYDSEVEAGSLLAKVDTAVYQSQVDQAEANLARAQADLGQYEAKLVQCEAEWKRAQTLQPKKAIAESDFDVDVANYKVARANLEVGKATVKQAEAALKIAQRNFEYCFIRSPVKGVIIDRRVNVGQTVVSAMTATSLFLIAKDLTRMQVWASVNEADIGRIHKGMPVTFTVDAYPNETFHGVVNQIRLNATITQSVVTYTVVVDTDNSDLRLYPYLTANANFQVEHRENVLRVPSGALRWKPRPKTVADEYRSLLASLGKDKLHEGDPAAADNQPGKTAEKDETKQNKKSDDPKSTAALEHAQKHGGTKSATTAGDSTSASAAKSKKHVEHGIVWVKDGILAKPVRVRIGVTDGIDTEISGPGIEDGTEIIIGETKPDQAGDDMGSPFTPKVFKRSGGPAKGPPKS
jgi:HlyD family secretion protein